MPLLENSEPAALSPGGADKHTDADIAIIGAGLSGTITAIRLGRLGYSVTLFDLHESARAEFRAEQLVGPQIGHLAELGLLGPMTRESRLMVEAVNGRRGKILDRTRVDQYGVPYQAMVDAVRSQLPASVRLVPKRVASITTGPDTQRVVLSDGEAITTRLVVMATGLASVLTKRLGIDIRTIRAGHSLALGFDVAIDNPEVVAALPLVYYGDNGGDMIDYLALFPMHDVVRANLFCYQEQQSDWTRAFCRDPKRLLLEAMPGLRELLGDFAITSSVQARSNDLRVAADPARDGVVLVGDAFQTPCPAAGTGIDRLLSDVEVLCTRHVPNWFASPGMERAKIAGFYADPVKQAFDAECLRMAEYRRAVSTRQSLWWTVHRKQVFFRRRMKALLAKRLGREPAMPAAGSMAG